MSPLERPISGTALSFSLSEEMKIVREQLGPVSRIARTVVKNGPLRVTLIGLAPGGTLAPHSTEGPITLQVLDGAVDFDADGQTHALATGSVIALGAGVVHSVRSTQGGMVLLTVVASGGS